MLKLFRLKTQLQHNDFQWSRCQQSEVSVLLCPFDKALRMFQSVGFRNVHARPLPRSSQNLQTDQAESAGKFEEDSGLSSRCWLSTVSEKNGVVVMTRGTRKKSGLQDEDAQVIRMH
jgi:hypothetical protein